MKTAAINNLVSRSFDAASAAVAAGDVTTDNLFSAAQQRYAENIKKAASDKAAKKIEKAEKKVAKATKKFEKEAKKAAKKAKKAEGAVAAPASNEYVPAGEVASPDFFAELNTKAVIDGHLTSSALRTSSPTPAQADSVDVEIHDIDGQDGTSLDEVVEKNAGATGAMADALRKANESKPNKK